MVKVGDKVVVVGGDWSDLLPGEILEVTMKTHNFGFWATDLKGTQWYVKTSEMEGAAKIIVKPYTETEAEKRGAKFGVTGVVKSTGDRVVFVKERNGFWRVFDENGMDYDFGPSEIRLDHEPEYVAWASAPEHLRYDASRVYFDGKPVKWIAKPEGSVFDVVVTVCDGSLEFSGKHLTVKL